MSTQIWLFVFLHPNASGLLSCQELYFGLVSALPPSHTFQGPGQTNMSPKCDQFEAVAKNAEPCFCAKFQGERKHTTVTWFVCCLSHWLLVPVQFFTYVRREQVRRYWADNTAKANQTIMTSPQGHWTLNCYLDRMNFRPETWQLQIL